MKFLGLVIVLIIGVSAKYKKLKLERCGGDGSVVVSKIDISPMPVKLHGKVNVNVKASITRELKGPIGMQVKIYRKTFLGFIKIPVCVKNIGSCSFKDICKRLEKYKKKGCPNKLKVHGLNLPRCYCPLPTGNINLSLKNIQLPKLPKALSVFTKGDYRIEVRLTQKKKVTTCYKAYLSLA